MRFVVTLKKGNISAYNFLRNMPKVNLIHVITYFSFVENVSLKHELCAVNNAA